MWKCDQSSKKNKNVKLKIAINQHLVSGVIIIGPRDH